MLRRFLYLDTDALGQYVTALEGGALTEAVRRATTTGELRGGLQVPFASAGGSRGGQTEESQSFSDTDGARFDRLLRAADQDPDSVGWIEVMEVPASFEAAAIGSMVSWECDVYVPDVVKLMAGSGEALQAIEVMQKLLPSAEALGLPIDDVPDQQQLEAMSGFIGGMNASLVVVGEDDDSDWTVSGRVRPEFVQGPLEGRATVVGKASKILGADSFEPFLAFPGMTLGSREQRRALRRQRPTEDSRDQYLQGPAILLDLLAIYR